MLHKLKLNFRRRFRKRQRQFAASAEQSGDTFEKYFIQRLGRFGAVWRVVTGWLVLMLLIIGCLIVQLQALSGYYQSRQPIPGGIYTEGIIGSFTNANPIYATNEVDKTVSKLLFAGLFKYDNHNQLTGDLAQDWSVNASGTVYTVHLRPNLTWQDGQPLTAEDVAFTYKVIQNPDAESPLLTSWQGINVSAKDAQTVTFTLPNPLSSFMTGMTNGIIPKHLLQDVPMVGMRSVAFNTQSPVGAGPFKWRDIDVKGVSPDDAEESIGFSPSASYWAGKPKLKSFVVHAYAKKATMIAAYEKGELTAMSGLKTTPPELKPNMVNERDFTLTAETMVFFKTSSGPLADVKVRQALVQAADPSAVIKELGRSLNPAREPLLSGQLGYDSQFAQKTADLAAAKQSLDADGWLVGSGGIREKNGQKLRFSLSLADTPEYNKVAQVLASQWHAAGVEVELDSQDEASFRSLFSSFNPDGSHTYDAVLYGITVGADPDVYVYWNSSQADIRSNSRLNFSDYKSLVADDALDAGRTRSDPRLRVIKYQAFLKQWQQDAPALGLYQPRYLYISRVPVYGLEEHSLNDSSDRLYSVHDWMIRTARVTNE